MRLISPQGFQEGTAMMERIKMLEAQNRWMMDSLEWMVSLGDVLVGFSPEQGPNKILNTSRLYLRRLIPFQTLSFLTIHEEDSDFTLVYCEPETDQPLLQKELELQIEEGRFAWALQQNRHLLVTSAYFDTPLILHPLVTRSNVVGLFAGILPKEKQALNEMESNLLTLILFNTAQGLENAMLYQKINEQNRNLEKIVQKRTEELQHALELAKVASAAKGMFLANMSHEIRTPLNAVIGYTDMLLETGLNEEQFDYAKTIRSSGQTLLSLINDILDFSKIEAGQLHLECIEFDPEGVLYEVCKMICPKIGQKPVELLCRIGDHLPSLVKGDRHRFEQVLLNLVGNAAKFTEHGEIEITIDQEEVQADRMKLHVMVRDTGIGIPREKLSVIFDLFQQADGSTTRRYGGTGLGLAICKQISKAMGGDVWAESELGQGSLFHFTAWFEKLEKDQKRIFSSPFFANRKVLLLDGHSARRELLQTLLKSFGIEVKSASGEEEILIILQRFQDSNRPFHLCLIDIDSPWGWRVAQTLHQNGGIDLPLLSLSPPLEQNVQRFREAGFRGFLQRPLRRDRLFELLEKHFQDRNREVEISEKKESGEKREFFKKNESEASVRVLLAEDHPVNQRMMVKMLEKMGCRVDTANNGKEAICRIEQDLYDLVLMDCQMPEMDGYSATEEIRKRGGLCEQIPIIAVTAHAMVEDRERCLKAGMNDYLSKPVRKEALSEMIEKWVRPK